MRTSAAAAENGRPRRLPRAGGLLALAGRDYRLARSLSGTSGDFGDIGAYVETIVVKPVPIEDYRDRERRKGVEETRDRAEEPAKKGDS